MNNQRGLATFEIILVVMIIAVLTTVAVPKMARLVDKVQLDYEMKIFLSTLDFAKSLNKNAFYNGEIFQYTDLDKVSMVQINIIENLRRYEIKQDSEVLQFHDLPKNFSIELNGSLSNTINFFEGKSGHVTLTSKLGDKRYIYFDSVGRWSGANQERYQ